MLFPPLAMFLSSMGGLAAGFTGDVVNPERKNLVFLSWAKIYVTTPVSELYAET